MVERNMCNAVMRGIVVPPGSRATSRAKGSRWNLGYLASGRQLFASAVRIGKARGQVRAAIIDFGGFLGVGNRKIAVDWNALHFALGRKDPIILDLTRDQVKAAPEYKDGRPLVLIGTAETLQPYPASE
jgi:hypothetical protein